MSKFDKLCTRCNTIKPQDAFRPQRRVCLVCEAEGAKARREAKKAAAIEPVPERTITLPRQKPDECAREGDDPQGPTILVIPDTQVRPGVPIDHFQWIGRYINENQPDFVVHMGDHVDFPSLSRYDSPRSKALNGYETQTDYDSAAYALQELMLEVEDPTLSEWHVCLGNHENRREIALEKDSSLSIPDPRVLFNAWGWEVHEFLDVFDISGVHFSHFFPRSASGRITQTKRGAPTAGAQAQRERMSTVAGHAQGLSVAIRNSGMGRVRAIIAGSFYLHGESYMPDNNYWRGCLELRDVRAGDYELREISMRYLRRKYGQAA